MGNHADRDLQALTGEDSLVAQRMSRDGVTDPAMKAKLASAYTAAVQQHTEDETETIWVHQDNGSPCDHVGAGQGTYFCRQSPDRVVLTEVNYQQTRIAGQLARHVGDQMFDHTGIGASIEDYSLTGMARDARYAARSLRGYPEHGASPGRHRLPISENRIVHTVRAPILNDDAYGPED